MAMATWSATDATTFPGECVVMFKIIVQLAPEPPMHADGST